MCSNLYTGFFAVTCPKANYDDLHIIQSV